jgi:hypothetical protein
MGTQSTEQRFVLGPAEQRLRDCGLQLPGSCQLHLEVLCLHHVALHKPVVGALGQQLLQ